MVLWREAEVEERESFEDGLHRLDRVAVDNLGVGMPFFVAEAALVEDHLREGSADRKA